MTLQEKIEKVLKEIPYDKIREEAFAGLAKDGIVKGVGEDTYFMCLEQVDLFKRAYMKKVKQEIWDHCFRAIRKTLAHDLNDWTKKKCFEESVKEDLSQVDIGEAATA